MTEEIKERKVVLNENAIPITEFSLSMFCPNATICMIAKRGSGKSVLCRELLYHFSFLPGAMIIAPTDKESMFYGKFFPKLYIHYEYDSDKMKNLLHRQSLIVKKAKDKFKIGKKCDPRICLIMDDCLADDSVWKKDQSIKLLFYNGRHRQITFILTMQYPMGIIPSYRTNIDYVFLFYDDTYSNQKRMHEHYAGMFPSLRSFIQVYDELTKDYGCMVLVRRGSRRDFTEKIFWYKANNNLGKKK